MARQLHLNFVGIHDSISSQPPPYGVLRARSGLNLHTWGDQDTTHATLMPDTDRRYGRPGRDGILFPTHETPDSDSTQPCLVVMHTPPMRGFCGAGCKQRPGVQRIDLRRWSPTRTGVWDRGWILWRIGLFCLQLHT